MRRPSPPSSEAANPLRTAAPLPRRGAKARAALVVAGVLALQGYVVARPRAARWYPFVDYPMYARSAREGEVLRLRELRARTCEAAPRTWRVTAWQVGEQESRFHRELSLIAAGRPGARRHRARLSRTVAARPGPRPCALQLWERAVVLEADGADARALRVPRWTPLREWRVDRPDSVVTLVAG